MKAIALFLGVLSVCVVAAQQSTIKGVVSIHNSETLTGKKQYVANAQVADEFGKATQQLTDASGQFQLIFVNQADKSGVSFSVSKPGLQVVNQTALSAIAGQQEKVSISMANPDSIAEYRRRIYNVGRTEGEKRLEYLLKNKTAQLTELRKNASQNTVRIKMLEAELEKLDKEGKGLEEQVKELARKYAPVNLDDATALVRNAFRLFQGGFVDSAAQLLQAASLQQNVQAVLNEREKIAAIRQETGQRETRANQAAKGYTEALQLKAELHKLRYESDSVINCYELLVQLDTANVRYLIEYADYLGWTNREDKAIIQAQKALTICRRWQQDGSQRSKLAVALVLYRLGRYFQSILQYTKAEAAYEEALEIMPSQAKENPIEYEHSLAAFKLSLAKLYIDMYSNGSKLSNVASLLEEALVPYERLTKIDAKHYEEGLVSVWEGMGMLYFKKGNFDSAETVFIKVSEAIKRIAKEKATDLRFEDFVAEVQDRLGQVYMRKENYAKADTVFKEALIIRQRLAKEDPQSYAYTVGISLEYCAAVSMNRKDYLKAIDNYNKALSIYAAKAEMLPAFYENYVSSVLSELGGAYLNIKAFDSAKQALMNSLQIAERWLPEYPENYGSNYTKAARQMTTLFMTMPDSLLAGTTKNEAITQLNNRVTITARLNPVIGNRLFSYWGDNSWDACEAGQFAWAENFALKAMQLDSSQLWVQTNLAHALLFQGKYAEAEKLYRRLKPLPDKDGKSYGIVCLENLAVLEKAGFTHPDLDKIKALLKE